jgi:hypothetical protein
MIDDSVERVRPADPKAPSACHRARFAQGQGCAGGLEFSGRASSGQTCRAPGKQDRLPLELALRATAAL